MSEQSSDMIAPGLIFAFRILLRFDAGPRLRFEPAFKAGVLARLESGQTVAPEETYCRVTPTFEVPAGAHDWLARTLFLGKGERRGAESVFDYYAVT